MECIKCKHCHADIPPQDRVPRHQGHCFQCWNLDIPELKADRDAGWGAASKLCESLRHVHAYLFKSGNLSDADELEKVILWFAAARARREGR